ncbi:MAG: hypothetical protein ISS12_10025 [Candidatus Marinimicrobia bacterium]|nr:hypothetical protein [Candidatus Neomarinimicrobiota bacterium]
MKIIFRLLTLLSIALAHEWSIEIEPLGTLVGRYSFTYSRYLSESLSTNARIQIWNADFSPFSKVVSYDDARISDASIYLGTNYFPFNNQKNLYGGLGLEMGRANIKVEKHTPLNPDSIQTSGFFITPTLSAGWKFVTKRGLSISPEIVILHNVSFINYSRIQKWPTFHEGVTWQIRWDDLQEIRKGTRIQVGVKIGLQR